MTNIEAGKGDSTHRQQDTQRRKKQSKISEKYSNHNLRSSLNERRVENASVHSVPGNAGTEEGKRRRNMEYFKYKSCNAIETVNMNS